MESQSSGRGVHWGSGIGPRYRRQSLPPGSSFFRFWLHEIASKRGKLYEIYWKSRNVKYVFWTFLNLNGKVFLMMDMLFVSPFGAEVVWVVFVASPIERHGRPSWKRPTLPNAEKSLKHYSQRQGNLVKSRDLGCWNNKKRNSPTYETRCFGKA